MPPRFQVRGGQPLAGSVRPAGNKNAALPILAATLLADGPVRVTNVPRIKDVESMASILADLGAAVEWTGPNALTVDTRGAEPKPLDPTLCARIRASILLAAPLVARFGKVILPPPGGDVIGRRRVDTHFLVLEAMGATIRVGERYEIEARHLTGADVFLDEPSVTGTENALMAAVAARGRTILRNAAAEPHVQDLARCLVAMGARLEGRPAGKVSEAFPASAEQQGAYGFLENEQIVVESLLTLVGEPTRLRTVPRPRPLPILPTSCSIPSATIPGGARATTSTSSIPTPAWAPSPAWASVRTTAGPTPCTPCTCRTAGWHSPTAGAPT